MAKQRSENLGGAAAKKTGKPSTQRYLDIAEIREDVVVMRDGTLRGVLAVSSINFALKSEDEQNAVISQYVQFLNTLDFPFQIVVHSRKLQIEGYLEKLGELERAQTNELLKAQMVDYRQYIKELVTLGEIMTKTFYAVVPYSPLTDARKGFFERFREAFSPAKLVRLKEKFFQERREELQKRVGYVSGGLQSIGLTSVQLDTQALIELFYGLYNPVISENQQLVDVEKLSVEQ